MTQQIQPDPQLESLIPSQLVSAKKNSTANDSTTKEITTKDSLDKRFNVRLAQPTDLAQIVAIYN